VKSVQSVAKHLRRSVIICGGYPWLWMLSLFLVGLGARLWLIHQCGSPVPIWDQWEEARVVYLPYFEGKLSLGDLLSAHNDHRIFFHRIYSLALLLLNQQWDGQLLMVGNAIMQCATLTGLGWLMCRWVEKRYWILIWLPLVLVLALPFGWENSLSGFQSFFYFSVLFSLLTLWLLGLHRPGSVRWWCGAAAAIMGLFTLSSGFLAVVAVFGLEVFRIWRQPQSWKQRLPTMAFCAAVAVAGFLLLVDVKHHHIFRAHSALEFVMALANNLAWPWIVVPPFAILSLVPLAALAWFYFQETEDRPAEEITLAIGFWVFLLGAAAAYARGAEGKGPGWRHMEFSSFILVANCFSIAILLSRYWRAPATLGNAQSSNCKMQFAVPRPVAWLVRSGRHILSAAFILWAVACVLGLAMLNSRAWQIDIPERVFYSRCHLQLTRAFMATDDVRVLDHKPKPELPLYEFDPDPHAPPPLHVGELMAKALRDPRIREILPACVREPLAVGANPELTRGFVTNGFRLARPEPRTEVSWGSFSSQGSAGTGSFESLPARQSRFPYLQISVAGDLGEQNLSLELVDLATGRRIPVKPSQTPGNKWLDCYVRAPAGAFEIVARDASETAWFAFKAPREVGRFSFWAIQILRTGIYLLFIGLGLFLFSVIVFLRCRASSNDSAPQSSTNRHSEAQRLGVSD
jgi:hypothetical protein